MQRGFQKGKRFSFVFNGLQMLTQDLLKYCNRVKAQSAELPYYVRLLKNNVIMSSFL